MASSNGGGTPERNASPADLQKQADSASKNGMMSDYFAQSDAKMETFKKPGKYSVYLQTQRIVTVGQT